MKNGQVFFPYQGDQEIQRWVNTCTYSTRLGLETIPWDIAFHFHKRQYRVLLAWLIFLVCFHFIQFPMGQHCHNLVSHPAFHLAIILLHLDNSQNTPWWSWAYEKVNSHGSWNIFCHPKINSLRFWVFRGQGMAATACWIFGQEYTASAAATTFQNCRFMHWEGVDHYQHTCLQKVSLSKKLRPPSLL